MGRGGWIDELSETQMLQVQHEAANVSIYLVKLADNVDVELGYAVRTKLELNRVKYPAELVRGSTRNYTEY